ncbi:Putative septation protein SpoVG [Limihaloglobus sulfuriphilus]|uniref:Putative septation protein SpoVG n=1 Tax=Limihaloglobus sulfuriphilus TaxID=1851148 RepID=A0A1Q2MB84_9BACT|nr:SpoVG family protein [Limihaloglobus sulfuriphilus]AQQ69983.1 Putative septation protein SpoVG [Limihaloglobus sulfuriphilus]
MEITEVRVKLVTNKDDRLKAFCSMTFDNCFVVRDIKIIEGANGLFVAMPSRKMSDHCDNCGGKNYLRARFCSNCGTKLDENRNPRGDHGRVKLHADIAHPIDSDCRDMIHHAIIKAFNEEVMRSGEPGYKPQDFDTPDY